MALGREKADRHARPAPRRPSWPPQHPANGVSADPIAAGRAPSPASALAGRRLVAVSANRMSHYRVRRTAALSRPEPAYREPPTSLADNAAEASAQVTTSAGRRAMDREDRIASTERDLILVAKKSIACHIPHTSHRPVSIRTQ